MTASSSTSEPRRAGLSAGLLRAVGRLSRVAGLIGLALALLVVLAVDGRPVSTLRLVGFDNLQRLRPRVVEETPVVIVEIDRESLQRYGQWPWPRNLLAELIARIHAQRPAVLGIDVLWPEPDRLSPGRWAGVARTLPSDLAQRLALLPDYDELLARAIAAGPTVIGVGGLKDGPGRIGPSAPVLRHGDGDLAAVVPHYATTERSLPEIERAARGHGLLSVEKDRDGQVRRLPMLATVNGTPIPSLTLEMLRVLEQADRVDAYLQDGAVAGVRVGSIALPTEPDGAIRLALSLAYDGRFVSAARLLDGTLPDDRLTDRLVLLGITGLGLVDIVTTPLGTMVGVEAHAQLLESVNEARLAQRPRWGRWAEAAALALAGLALIALLPGRRLIWYAPAGLAMAGAFGGLALGAWMHLLWFIDAVMPTLGVGSVLMALVGGSFVEADAQRRRLRRELEAERLAAARVAGELEAARRIQMGILPRPDALARDPRFDLDAVLEPAKEIGGDLYDFFPVDARHLFVAVGDVTGKGVPASLFMALGKSLYKSCVLRGSLDPAPIMSAANQEISRDNPEMLFITLFAGLLDLDTGLLTYCNAGHEQPYAVRPGGGEVLALAGSGGPPLCVVDDFPYGADTYQMRPGEILCLVTDGITEAMNRDGVLLGHDPVRACLAALPADADAHAALAALRAAVAAHVGDADPSDDLTCVTVRWKGVRDAGESR